MYRQNKFYDGLLLHDAPHVLEYDCRILFYDKNAACTIFWHGYVTFCTMCGNILVLYINKHAIFVKHV